MYEELPTTQSEASELGVKYYFTGKPCPRGHTSIRYTSNYVCVECDLQRKGSMSRKAAIEKGLLSYIGRCCETCGRKERHTYGMRCVHCYQGVRLTNHELKLLLIRSPAKTVEWYSRSARRNKQAVRNAMRALNISPRNRPQHYVG